MVIILFNDDMKMCFSVVIDFITKLIVLVLALLLHFPPHTGGALRSFPQKLPLRQSCRVGSSIDNDLQIGWLRDQLDVVPVFLDCWRPSITAGSGSGPGYLCSLYVTGDSLDKKVKN